MFKIIFKAKEELKKIYAYKESIWILGINDLKARYAGSSLGFFWSILEPLLIVIVFSSVFPLILKAKFIDWVLFFLVGFIPHRYFERCTREVTTSIVRNKNILNQLNIPSAVILLSTALSNSISFILELGVILGIILIAGIKFTPLIFFLPLLFLTQLFIILGISFHLSISYVRYRDIEYILNVIFLLLMFLTPITYRLDLISQQYRNIYLLNPLARLVLLYQSVILYSVKSFVEYIPILENAILLFLFSLIILILGYFSFIKRKHLFEGRL
jgi:ABC-type polysaccharide/polyol phosphate export permease